MYLKCSCGSTKLHRFFYHKPKGIERFRCLECNRTYQVENGEMVEINLEKLFKKAIYKD